MALLNNRTFHNANPIKFMGLGGTVAAMGEAQQNLSSGRRMNRFYGDEASGFNKTSSLPNGYSPPYSWVLPVKGGGLAAYKTVSSNGNITLSVQLGKDLTSSITDNNSSISVNLTALGNFSSTLFGSSTVSYAYLIGIVDLVSTMLSEGSFESVIQLLQFIEANPTGNASLDIDLIAGITMESSVTGQGTVSSADMKLITGLLADLNGSGVFDNVVMKSVVSLTSSLIAQGDLTAAMQLLVDLQSNPSGVSAVVSNLKGQLSMSADITQQAEVLTSNSIAAAVWAAIAASNNDTGTMGEKLNDAGSAGNPWAATETGNIETDGTMGKLLKDTKRAADTAIAVSV
jgi:hypothetical protein